MSFGKPEGTIGSIASASAAISMTPSFLISTVWSRTLPASTRACWKQCSTKFQKRSNFRREAFRSFDLAADYRLYGASPVSTAFEIF